MTTLEELTAERERLLAERTTTPPISARRREINRELHEVEAQMRVIAHGHDADGFPHDAAPAPAVTVTEFPPGQDATTPPPDPEEAVDG